MYAKASVTVLSVEEQGCLPSTLILLLHTFEPQATESRNAMPAMELENAASATEPEECNSFQKNEAYGLEKCLAKGGKIN